MESRTYLLWFQLDRAAVKACQLDSMQKDNGDVQKQEGDLLQRIRDLPSAFSAVKWTQALEQCLDDGSVVYVCYSSNSHVNMRLYSNGLLTFDFQRLAPIKSEKHGSTVTLPNLQIIRKSMAEMKEHLGDFCLTAKCLDCPIYRGMETFSPYVITGDERLIQRDFTELVHEADSRWQNIKIYKSEQCGNVLYLDDDVMLAESDLVYTETLLGMDRNDFTNKTVLILGGGDGGLLHELVTRTKPKFVTMVEIDEEVITACRTHLRGVCGSILDKYQGSNYEIIIGDCVKYLKNAAENKEKFDYVVNDLTEFPVDKALYGFKYDFASSNIVLELSTMVLTPSGKYLARGNTMTSVMYRSETEKTLQQLDMQYKTFVKYVPSFVEDYFFVEAWKNTAPS